MSFVLLGILNSQAAGGVVIVAVAGYVAGGRDGSDFATVDKFAFSDDSRTTLATGLSIARKGAAGFFDPTVAGYAAGGRTGTTETSTVDKFAFPDDTRSTLATGLSNTIDVAIGFSDPSVAGYVAGGNLTGPVSGITDIVDKFAFPSDTRSVLTATLSAARGYMGGFANPSVAGYAAGGYRVPSRVDTVDKLTYATETTGTLGTGLSSARNGMAGFEDA